jgi:hypothetical protein
MTLKIILNYLQIDLNFNLITKSNSYKRNSLTKKIVSLFDFYFLIYNSRMLMWFEKKCNHIKIYGDVM